MDEYSSYKNEPLSTKFVHFVESIWPSIYRVINDFLWGTVHFVIDLITTAFRGFR